MAQPIYIVSGLPRSGTSMMMRMLQAAGLPVLSDGVREADRDNPRGYWELEAVKSTQRDASWVRGARGKVVKVISHLLQDLPADETYRVVFMRRKLDEVIASQEQMLERRGEASDGPGGETREMLAAHVSQVEEWIRGAANVTALFVSYNRMLEQPRGQAERVDEFLGRSLDVDAMVSVIEPGLYRNRG